MGGSYRRVISKWRRLGWEGWWGDSVDARFELARRAGELEGCVVLDMGCGHGVILSEAVGRNWCVGLDMSVARLEHARRVAPGARLVRGDILALPFKSEVFDVVLMGSMLEYPADKASLVAEAAYPLKAGGQVLATTPNRNHWLYWATPHVANDIELERAFAGFGRAAVQGYNPLPSLDLLLPRRWLRMVPASVVKWLFVPSPVLAAVPGITAMLRWLMRFTSLRARSKFLFVSAVK